MGCLTSKKEDKLDDRRYIYAPSPAAVHGHRRNEPDLIPTRKKKRDIVPDPYYFTEIDDHALNAPDSVRTSIANLARYLIQPAKNDLEKVRTFYRWITNNISYDTVSAFSGECTFQSSDPDKVILKRTGVCLDYAVVFSELCKEVSIPCKSVKGFSKELNRSQETSYTYSSKPNHAWNLVLIDGEWRPIECTWGTGYLDNDEFVWDFNEFYFLTDPEDIAFTHFPFIKNDPSLSKKYQVLKNPLKLEDFNRAVKPYRVALEWGMAFLSHREHTIVVDGEIDIQFCTYKTKLASISCYLMEKESGKTYREYVFLERLGRNLFNVKVRPPYQTSYTFQLYGKSESETSPMLEQLVEYTISCTGVMKSLRPFPNHFGLWGAKEEALQYGFAPDIMSKVAFVSENGELELPIDLLKKVKTSVELEYFDGQLTNLDRFVMISGSAKSVTVKTRFPKTGYYKLTLFASAVEDRNTLSYIPVAYFLVDCKKSLKLCQSFPKVFPSTDINNCVLEEPLCGEILAFRNCHFRMRSDVVKDVIVDSGMITRSTGNLWEGNFTPSKAGEVYIIYGKGEDDTPEALYQFNVV